MFSIESNNYPHLINVHAILEGVGNICYRRLLGVGYGIYHVILWVECKFTELAQNEKMLTLSDMLKKENIIYVTLLNVFSYYRDYL